VCFVREGGTPYNLQYRDAPPKRGTVPFWATGVGDGSPFQAGGMGKGSLFLWSKVKGYLLGLWVYKYKRGANFQKLRCERVTIFQNLVYEGVLTSGRASSQGHFCLNNLLQTTILTVKY